MKLRSGWTKPAVPPLPLGVFTARLESWIAVEAISSSVRSAMQGDCWRIHFLVVSRGKCFLFYSRWIKPPGEISSFRKFWFRTTVVTAVMADFSKAVLSRVHHPGEPRIFFWHWNLDFPELNRILIKLSWCPRCFLLSHELTLISTKFFSPARTMRIRSLARESPIYLLSFAHTSCWCVCMCVFGVGVVFGVVCLTSEKGHREGQRAGWLRNVHGRKTPNTERSRSQGCIFPQPGTWAFSSAVFPGLLSIVFFNE